LKDNPNLDKSPFKKGTAEPEKLKLTLKDTKGNLHKRFFPEKDKEKWDDSKWISDANRWRNQVLRRIMRHDPTFKGRGIRPKWGMREAISLKAEVQKKVKEVGNRRLTGQEWEEVTQAHNKRFAGSKVFAGERLMGGQINKSSQDIEKRTAVAIRALFERNHELKTFFNDLIVETVVKHDVAGGSGDVKMKAEVSSEDQIDLARLIDDETDDESPTKKGTDDQHGGEIDLKLEEPSDDEDEDQRPASTQNGARCIACA
jgi:hypothetical protein